MAYDRVCWSRPSISWYINLWVPQRSILDTMLFIIYINDSPDIEPTVTDSYWLILTVMLWLPGKTRNWDSWVTKSSTESSLFDSWAFLRIANSDEKCSYVQKNWVRDEEYLLTIHWYTSNVIKDQALQWGAIGVRPTKKLCETYVFYRVKRNNVKLFFLLADPSELLLLRH